nr:restriction endonuclease subunit S [Asaia prunellae]
MLPEGWDAVTIDKISKIVTSGSRDWSQYYANQGDKFVRMTNLGREGIRVSNDDMKYVSLPVTSSEGRRTSLESGDVLISITAELGKIGLVPPGFGTAFINQHLALVRMEPHKAVSEFVAHLLSSEGMNKKLNGLNDAGAKAGLNLSTIRSFVIPLPPLPEQKKIAAILSTWDRAIEVMEKLLANSQRQKKALMQQLLTGKKRLPGFTGEWHKRRLSDCCYVQMGSSPKSEFYNDAGVGLPLLQGNADIKDRRSAPRIYTTDVTKTCKVGDILLSVRAPVGNVAISAHHACIGRGIACIQTNDENLSSFIYQSFLNLEDSWSTVSQGSTFEAVSGDDLRKTILYLPTLPEQKAIASVLTKADEEITLLKSDLSRLRQEKKALMQQLLTGKRRVKIEADAG